VSASRRNLNIVIAALIALTHQCLAHAQSSGDVARGRKIFSALNCEMCHPGGGNALEPTKPLKGAGFAKKYSSDNAIAMLIRNGSQNGGMPAFRRDQLTDQQLCDLIAYLRSLTPRSAPGKTVPANAVPASKVTPASKAAPAAKVAAPAPSSVKTQPSKRK
jgi:mono/diheme cytochrome c family protein